MEPKNVKTSRNRDLTLTEVMEILGRKLLWIVAGALIAAVLAGILTGFLIEPVYTSTATMYIYTYPQGENTGASYSDLMAAESLAGTYKEILRSGTMLSQVCGSIGNGLSVDALEEMVEISLIDDTQLLEVSVTTHSPALSKTLAESFAELGPTLIAATTKGGSVEILDYPQLAVKPDGPGTAVTMVLALFAGAIISAVCVLLRGIYDTRIYSEADLKGYFDLRVLGTVPETAEQAGSRLLGPDSPEYLKESFARIRAELMLGRKGGSMVLAVTSPGSAESGSLIAADLAVSFAMLGSKTLLIDGNLKDPAQHRLWNLNFVPGLSELLSQKENDVIHAIDGLALSVMTAGAAVPNSAELICSAGFSSMLELVRDAYDYVIIDTPSVNEVSDARIIASQADGVILTVCSGRTGREAVAQAVETLDYSGASLAGMVIGGKRRKK